MDSFTPCAIADTFARAKQDNSSSVFRILPHSLFVEDFDDEAVWQQLEHGHKTCYPNAGKVKPHLELARVPSLSSDDSDTDNGDKDEGEGENEQFAPENGFDKEEEDDFGDGDFGDSFADVEEDEDEDDNDEHDSKLGDVEENSEDEAISVHERHQRKLQEEIARLEEENLAPKSWQMSGEAAAPARPENSLLEDHLDVNRVTRSAPEVTEEKTKSLEDIIIQRIKDQAWDDVVRREKPVEKPYEYRKTAPLDQEKSKLSLAQVYEKEYLEKMQKDAPKEEPQEVKDIKYKMKLFFAQLDALSNYHYTPKAPSEEVKIVTNRPAVEIEEVTPAAASDATLLAPEEVMPTTRGEVKASTEKTTTDRKRERRAKKSAQHLRAAKKQKKFRSGKNKTEAAVEQIKKQAKSGKVQIVGTGSDARVDKSLKSSSAFFARLQDESAAAVAKAKVSNAKKREAIAKNSSHFML